MKYLFLLFALTSQAAFSQSVTLGAACVRYTTEGECITQSEFEALDGISGNIQDQIDTIDDASSDVAANLATHEADTSTHGISSAIVGTTEVQTLTNKTLTAPAISSPTGLVKGDVGLGNVDNTSDANKPVSTATQTALDLKANLASPALTGNPTAPTQTAGNNSTRIATTAYVDGAIATEDALVVHKTGNESISGTKTFTGKLVASSTSNGATPCPVMTQAQRDAVSSPSNGDCVFNSTSNKLNVYNSTLSLWKEVSGSGGLTNQLLTNGDFEDGTGSWTLTAGSGSSETSTVLAPGIKSYKATLSAQTLALYQDVSTGASQFNGTVQGMASCRVKTTVSGVYACSRTAGSTNLNNCAEVTANAGWVHARAPFQLNGTSSGVAVVSGTLSGGVVTPGNITGDVYVDECFVGMAQDFDQYPAGTTWKQYGSFAADTTLFGQGTMTAYGGLSNPCRYRQVLSNLDVECKFNGGTVAATLGAIVLPTGFTVDSSNLPNNTTASSGKVIGRWTTGGANTLGNVVTAAGTATDRVYIAGTFNNANMQIPAQVSTYVASSQVWNINFSVPITSTATVNTYSDQCGSDPSCENVFTATVSSAGVVSGENIDWLNGDFVVTATNVFTGTVNSSLGLTTGMGCTISGNNAGGSQRSYDFASSSSTQVVANTYNGAAAAAVPFIITCTKRSPDFKARREVVGVFKDMVKSKGLATPALVGASVDASEAVTENSSSFITSCTNADPSVCSLTTNFFSSDPLCWANPTSAGTVAAVTADTTSSVTIDRTDASTPFKVFCLGVGQ